jgi:hypothetical protein
MLGTLSAMILLMKSLLPVTIIKNLPGQYRQYFEIRCHSCSKNENTSQKQGVKFYILADSCHFVFGLFLI